MDCGRGNNFVGGSHDGCYGIRTQITIMRLLRQCSTCPEPHAAGLTSHSIRHVSRPSFSKTHIKAVTHNQVQSSQNRLSTKRFSLPAQNAVWDAPRFVPHHPKAVIPITVLFVCRFHALHTFGCTFSPVGTLPGRTRNSPECSSHQDCTRGHWTSIPLRLGASHHSSRSLLLKTSTS